MTAKSTWPHRKPPRLALERILPLMFLPIILIISVLFLLHVIPGQRTSHNSPAPPPDKISPNLQRREAIESAFDFAWDGYYTTAFPHDELKPSSNTAGYSRNDWGATAVDALGTAILMEKSDIVKIVLAHVESIDFHVNNSPISVFESTIRYMGGLLSAYELLKGPFASLNVDERSIDVLLEQARNLADVLAAAFREGDTLPSGILAPYTLEGNGKNSLAGAGTMVLEWTKLSDLTNDTKYATLAQKAEDTLLDPQPKSAEKFPGLVGTEVNIITGQFQPGIASWGGSSDSFYEYLLKFYMYDPTNFPKYKERWIQAADSTIKHLASSPEGFPDITFLGQYDGSEEVFVAVSGHMECFAGGNFLLGGAALNETKYTDFGLKLVNGCHHTYISTMTGIGPENFMWIPSSCNKTSTTTSPQWKCPALASKAAEETNSKSGFWITESSYNLRPEVIESYYYAYRMTRDSKYRDWAWDAWKAINNTVRVEKGFNYLRDVNVAHDKREFGDNQESYFFSETLKYLFLIFSEEGEWHVNFEGRNEWVYNTEGHPFKVRG